MMWLRFVGALLLGCLLQAAASIGRFESLDCFLVLTLICGLTMPSAEARLAAWLTGLTQDALTVGPFGAHAFCLGLVGLLTTQFRELINRQLWQARWTAATCAAIPGTVVLVLYLRWHLGAVGGTFWHGTWLIFATSVLAGLLAGLITGLPAFQASRRRSFY